MKAIKTLLILSLGFILFSCNDDNSADPVIGNLSFEKSDYSVGTYSLRYIPIIGGSKNYTITSDNENIIKATYTPLSEYALPSTNKTGHICVEGLNMGTANITVKDNILGQTQVLNLTVTKRYITFTSSLSFASAKTGNTDDELKILKDIIDNPSIKDTDIITLIGNENGTEANKFYIFSSYENLSKGVVSNEGSYRFDQEEDKQYLVLDYINKGVITSHKYLITAYGEEIATISSFLNLDQETLKGHFLSHQSLKLHEDLTNVYKVKYPELSSAFWHLQINYNPDDDPEIALNLIK